MEHMRPEGISQGYFCFRCGGSCNMYASGHGPGKCDPKPELVQTLMGLNSREKDSVPDCGDPGPDCSEHEGRCD